MREIAKLDDTGAITPVRVGNCTTKSTISDTADGKSLSNFSSMDRRARLTCKKTLQHAGKWQFREICLFASKRTRRFLRNPC